MLDIGKVRLLREILKEASFSDQEDLRWVRVVCDEKLRFFKKRYMMVQNWDMLESTYLLIPDGKRVQLSHSCAQWVEKCDPFFFKHMLLIVVFIFTILTAPNVPLTRGKSGYWDNLLRHKKQVGLNQFLRSSWSFSYPWHHFLSFDPTGWYFSKK